MLCISLENTLYASSIPLPPKKMKIKIPSLLEKQAGWIKASIEHIDIRIRTCGHNPFGQTSQLET